MARVQLALNVSDVESAVEFYSKLFKTPPTKVQPGYANFAISEPPLKLVLIETPEERGSGTMGALNHIGVELDNRAEVHEAAAGLDDAGLEAGDVHEIVCCYALQDKVWIDDPDGLSWELYTVLADADASYIDHDVPSCACTAAPEEALTALGTTNVPGCC